MHKDTRYLNLDTRRPFIKHDFLLFLYDIDCSFKVFLISALGSVGFFLNELNAAFEKAKSGAPRQVAQLLSLFLTGLYGREEFFLCSASVALVVALCSLIIGITRSHNKAPCAAFVSVPFLK